MMRTLVFLLAIFVISACSNNPSSSEEKDSKDPDKKEAEEKSQEKAPDKDLPLDVSPEQVATDVQAVWEQYRQAVLTNDGDLASQVVDRATVEYYDEMLDWAKNYNRKDLMELNALDWSVVLIIRHLSSKEELSGMKTGEELHRWIGSAGVYGDPSQLPQIGKISVEGRKAKAEMIANGQLYPDSYIHFNFEDDKWKVNIPGIMEIAKKPIDQALAQDGALELFITGVKSQLLELSGREAGEEIWLPLSDR